MSEVDDNMNGDDHRLQHLLDLPYEILVKVFRDLPRVYLPIIAPTCKTFRDVAFDPALWQELDLCKIRQVYNLVINSPLGLRRTISKCPQLRILRINEPWFDDDTLLHTIRKKCPMLEILDTRWSRELTGDGVASAMCELIDGTAPWNLRELYLTLNDIPADFFAKITPCIQELEVLDLNHCACTDDWEFMHSFSTIAQTCPKLKQFSIDGVQHVTSQSLIDFFSVRGSSLQCIELDGESLEDCVLGSIAEFCCELTTLRISFCQRFTDAGLTSLRGLSKLTSLKLKKGTSLSEKGFDQLFRHINPFPALVELDLTETSGLTDSSLVCIANSCPQLKSLSLAWCWELTDVSIDHVVRTCPGMLKLDLTGVKRLSDTAVVNIAEHLPRLKILIVKSVNNVSDSTLTNIVHALPDIIIINFYGTAIEREDLDWGSTGEVHCDGLTLSW